MTCGNNRISLNMKKTKELIVNFRRNRNKPDTISYPGQELEMVEDYRYVGDLGAASELVTQKK